MSDLDRKIDQAVEQLFNKYDANKNGYLEDTELVHIIRDVFSHLGVNEKRELTEEDVQKVMKALDTNRDGKVNKEELGQMIRRCMTKK